MLKLSKEPLLHFLLAGSILFAVYAAFDRAADNPAASPQRVHINASDVEWLAENWTRQWQRPPTPEELQALISDYINEQLLAREARALGLDDNDVIVRRRLAQKLTFIIDGTLRRMEPTDDELQRFYESHSERFRTEARISFVHIYFNPGRRADALLDANKTLKILLEAEARLPVEGLGDRSLIDDQYHDETERGVSSVFGPDFARAAFSLIPDTWSGPIQSGYGLHLIRVLHLRESRLRPLSEVRAHVMAEWKHAQEKVAKEKYLAELGKKYSVVLDETVKSLLANTPVSRTAAQ